MCILIGINQLGFGSVVPVLPLYARSFEVSRAASGVSIAVLGLDTDAFGIEPALAAGAGLLAAGGVLFAWRAPETYSRMRPAP